MKKLIRRYDYIENCWVMGYYSGTRFIVVSKCYNEDAA